MRKIILMALCFCLLVLPASAGTTLGNLDFEDYTVLDSSHSNFDYWAESGYVSDYNSGTFIHSGDASCLLSSFPGTGDVYISQSGTFTGIETIVFYAALNEWDGYAGKVYFDGDLIQTVSNYGSLARYEVDISAYNDGVHEIKFLTNGGSSDYCRMYVDDISFTGQSDYVSWNQSTYAAGDTATINYTYPSYIASNENFIDIRSYNSESSVWELEERRMVYVESGSILYIVPSYSSRQFRAELMTRVGVLFPPTEIGNATMQMTSEGASVVFDKYLYDRDENMTFGYYNMPSGSYVQFHSGPTATGATYFQQYSGLSGNGTAGYQLPSNGPYGELFYVRAYDSEGNQLSYDYAYTENEPTEKTTIHGRVRDADTSAVIEGALVTVGSWTTLTDSSGDYSLTINKGTWDIEISKTNYVTKTVDDFTFSGDSYSYSPYLQPDPEASTTLHGTIVNKVGGAISGAQITVSTSGVTKTAVSSSSGSWTISNMEEGETYTVKATATYYETHSGFFTFSSSSNTYAIVMVDASSSEEEDEDDDEDSSSSGGLTDDDDSSTSSSSDDGESTGRTAARETLEEAQASVPKMFSILIMIVFMAAIKKGSK